MQGNGGNGGQAQDSAIALVARGSSVTISGTSSLRADANGGNGGIGSTTGIGGNALVGGANGGLEVGAGNRLGVLTQRGTFTARDIVGSVTAHGGTGSTAGIASVSDGSMLFNVFYGDLTATSVGLVTAADVVLPNAKPGLVRVSNGTANIAGQFVFASAGPITVDFDTATLNAGSVQISGSDWVLPTTAPVLAGTIHSSSTAVFNSSNNILTYANVNSVGDFNALAPGAVSLGTINAADVTVYGGNTITVGAITSPGYVSVDNTVGASNAAGIGNITLASVTAGRDLGVFSNGSISATGALQTGANVSIGTPGGVTLGNVSAGLVNPSTISGDTYEIGIHAGGPLVTGNLASQTDIGLVSPSTISTGTLTGRDMLLLGTAGFASSAITASNRVLIADASMAALGGQLGGHFDPNLVFNGTSVASAGPITINGAVLAGSLTTNSGGNFTSGALTSANKVDITTGANALVNGAIQSGQNANINAQGGITVGNVTAGANPGTSDPIPFSIGLIANGGTLVAGNLSGTQSVGLAASGSITAGTLTGVNLLAGAGTSITTGAISITGQALLASFAMLPLGGTVGGNGTYDARLVFAAAPIAATGAITINGAVNTGQFFHAATKQGFTAGTIGAGTDLLVIATGPILTGTLTASAALGLVSAANVTTGDLTGASLSVIAGPSLISGNLVSNSGNIALSSTGTLTVGLANSAGTLSLTAPGALMAAMNGGTANNVSLAAIGAITISGGDVTVSSGSTINSNDSTTITATGSLTAYNVLAQNAETITVGGNASLRYGATIAGPLALNVGGSLSIDDTNGQGVTIKAGSLTAGIGYLDSFTNIAITTKGDMALSHVETSGGSITLNSGGLISGSKLKASGDIVSQSIGSTTILGLTGNETVTSSGGAVSMQAGSTLTAGAIIAAKALTLSAAGAIQIDSISAGNQVTITSDSFAVGTLTAPGAIVSTGGGLSIATTQALTLPSLSILGDIVLSSKSTLTTADVTSTSGAVTLSSAGSLTAGALSANTTLSLTTPGTITVGNARTLAGLTANGNITISGGDVNVVANNVISSKQALTVTGTGALNLDATVAATSVALTARTSLKTTGATANGTLTETAGGSIDTGQVNAAGIALTAGTTLLSGNMSSSKNMVISAGGNVSTASLTAAGTTTIKTGGTLNSGVISAFGDVLSQSVGATTAQGLTSSNGAITVTGADITVATPVSSALDTNITASGALNLGAVASTAGAVSLGSSLGLTAGAISAAKTVSLNTAGKAQSGSISAGSQVSIFASSLTLGNVTLPGTIVSTGGGLSISTTNALPLTVGAVTTAGDITINTPSLQVATGDVTSTAGLIALSSGGTLTTGAVNATKALSLVAGGAVSTAALTASGGKATVQSGGTLNAGVINSANGMLVTSTGAATVQGLSSSGAITFNSGSTFTSSGNIAAGDQIIGNVAGAMTLGSVTASGGAGTIELSSSQGNLTAGRISALTDVATVAGGSLSLGQVSGRDIVLLAGTDVQASAISAGVVTNAATGQVTGATGRVLIANKSASAAGGAFGAYNFNAVFNSTGGTVLSSQPASTSGAVNVTGTVNAQRFASYSQGAMTAQSVNAFGSTEVESGGLVTVGQRWTSPDLTIYSNDIAILPAQTLVTGTTTAGISSGTTGTVSLASINSNGAFIGDGLTAGRGYALSNAELALVQSGSLTIGAVVSPGLATTMTIGNLSLTGPQAGSNVGNQQSGAVQFITSTPQTKVVSGTIRVTGAVAAKGFLSTNQIQFQTSAFELDTTAGSLTVTDSAGAQAGGISITADRIHIAAASILDKLRADPLYTGRITDLNAAPATPSSGAVLSALALFLAPTQTLYIQNTGTAAVPAGFLVPLAGLQVRTQSGQSTATSISVVANGQFVGASTSGGTAAVPITGATAYQQLLQQTKLTGITADSTFNGCLIAAGTCGMAATLATPSLSSQIAVLAAPPLPAAPPVAQSTQQTQSPEMTAEPASTAPEPAQTASTAADPAQAAPAGSSDSQATPAAEKQTAAAQKEEKEAKAAAKAPIAPPAPMIDTRPLNPSVSVDQPVAGGGNPALFGIGAAANQPEGGVK